MNNRNLISLASRSIEDRQRIARLGGLARQKQRRHQTELKKALENLLRIDAFIEENSTNKRNNIALNYNGRNLNRCYSKYKANFYSAYNEDLTEAIENYIAKEEQRKKQKRKEINRRYYLKHKRTLRKP